MLIICAHRIDEELRAEEERQAAHAQWLASREEKKQAIQAALKWNSSKLPLKGAAAAAAAAAASSSPARRASVQSQDSSAGLSDVDNVSSPAAAAPASLPDLPPPPPPPPLAAASQQQVGLIANLLPPVTD